MVTTLRNNDVLVANKMYAYCVLFEYLLSFAGYDRAFQPYVLANQSIFSRFSRGENPENSSYFNSFKKLKKGNLATELKLIAV